MEKFEYLDLEISNKSKHKTNKEGFSLTCYGNHSSHSVTSEDKGVNTIIDLIMSLALNIAISDKSMEKINTHIHNSMVSRNEILRTQSTNLDYIKEQCSCIIKKVNKIKNLEKEDRDHRNALEILEKNIILKIEHDSNEIVKETLEIKELLKEIRLIALG